MLACRGNIYTPNQKRRNRNGIGGTINWRCVKGPCVGTAKTIYLDLETVAVGTEVDVILRKEHLHEPDFAEVEIRERVNTMKDIAERDPNVNPSMIVQEVTNEITDEEVLQRLPERQTLLRGINRAQNRNRPANPLSLNDLNFRSPYTETLNGERFLQYDTELADGNRVVIFYTIDDLRRLCSSESIFMDGTFKTVPSLFYQVSYRKSYCFKFIISIFTP